MDIALMSVDELKAHVASLQQKYEQISEYSQESSSKFGEKALVRKRKDLEITRSSYYNILASGPSALVFLARIQGNEQVLREEIALLENAKKAKDDLDEYIQRCIAMLADKEKSAKSDRR